MAFVVSILINVLQLIIIILLIIGLFKKRQARIAEDNKAVITREIAEQQIKDKYKDKEEQLNEDIKKAKNARDFLNIMASD